MKTANLLNASYTIRCGQRLNTARTGWRRRRFHVDIFGCGKLGPHKQMVYDGTISERRVLLHVGRRSADGLSKAVPCGSSSIENAVSQNRFISSSVKSKFEFSTKNSIPSSKPRNSFDKSSSDADRDDAIIAPEMTTKEKVQRLLQKYGVVFVGTYVGIYFTTLFSLFGLLECGLLDPELISQIFKVSKDLACETADVIGPTGSGASMDEAATAYAQEVATEVTKEKRGLVKIVTGYLQKYEWSSKYAEKLEQNPHLANLAVAWFMVKFTEPFRLAAAVAVVPKVAKMVGRKIPKEGR